MEAKHIASLTPKQQSLNQPIAANTFFADQKISNHTQAMINKPIGEEENNLSNIIHSDQIQAIHNVDMQSSKEDPIAQAKMQTFKKFTELAEKASLFEFGMSFLGAVLTGGQADWISYMHEAFGEFSENHVLSADEGKKEVHPVVATIFKFLGFAFGIKNEEGQSLKTTNDFVKAQDKLIGALNMFTSSLSGLVIAFKALPAAITGKQALDFSSKIPALHFLSTKVMPTLNAVFMWMTGSVKRKLAFDMQQHSYGKENKAEIDGAFTSGNQDYICGTNSLSLMLRQAIGTVSPKLANLLEPVLATWIAASAFKEGYSSFVDGEDEETPKYELHNLDKSVFGNGFYNLAKLVSDACGVKLPSVTQLVNDQNQLQTANDN